MNLFVWLKKINRILEIQQMICIRILTGPKFKHNNKEFQIFITVLVGIDKLQL